MFKLYYFDEHLTCFEFVQNLCKENICHYIVYRSYKIIQVIFYEPIWAKKFHLEFFFYNLNTAL